MLADCICYAADGMSKDLLLKLQGLLKLLHRITGSELQMCCCCQVKQGEPCSRSRQVVLGRRRAEKKLAWHSDLTLSVPLEYSKLISFHILAQLFTSMSISFHFSPSHPALHETSISAHEKWSAHEQFTGLWWGLCQRGSVVSSPAGSGCS